MKTLKQLRAELVTLKARAAAKKAELKEGMSADEVRAVDDAHAQMVEEIRKLTEQIERREAELEEAETRAANPAITPPATGPPAVTGAEPNAEAVRAADILSVGTQAGMPHLDIESAIRTGVSIADFRQRAFELLAGRSRQTQTDPARVRQDEVETRRTAMTEALSYRLGAPIPQAGPSAAARGYMSHGLIGLAAEASGYRIAGVLNARQIDEIFTRASHTTSDFPSIFGNALNRSLEQRYALAQPTYRRIARQRNFRDFRPHTTVKVGDFPMLEKVLEDGVIKYGTFSDGKETVSAYSYAKALRVTRQMLINDDLGAITDLFSSYGMTVALFEETTFYAVLNANLADGNPVFHASHKNLASPGTAIDVANVGLARAAMSKQQSLDKNPLLSNVPRILLTGPDKQTEAEMLLASITPATVSNVNIFSGRYDLLTTAQITGNPWYLFADPADGGPCNYRWGYLEGYDAPRVRFDEPFGTQGFAMSVEHDFGAGVTDYRGGYKNPGN